MSNANPTLTRAQLRSLSEDENSSPKSRLDAAGMLLDQFGATARNLRTVKRVARTFEKYVAASTRTQQQVRWWSERLKARLERISEAETAQPEDPDENETDSALSEDVATPKPIIANLDLLPVDGDDEFWDELIGAHSRRELFLMSWLLDASLSQREIIDAISNDPAKIAAHTLERKTWARTQQQLDQQFEADDARVCAELAQRRLDDRDELAKEIIASGVPLYEFTHDHDLNSDGLPALVRTNAGELLRAIDFIKTWPEKRAAHRPL